LTNWSKRKRHKAVNGLGEFENNHGVYISFVITLGY